MVLDGGAAHACDASSQGYAVEHAVRLEDRVRPVRGGAHHAFINDGEKLISRPFIVYREPPDPAAPGAPRVVFEQSEERLISTAMAATLLAAYATLSPAPVGPREDEPRR